MKPGGSAAAGCAGEVPGDELHRCLVLRIRRALWCKTSRDGVKPPLLFLQSCVECCWAGGSHVPSEHCSSSSGSSGRAMWVWPYGRDVLKPLIPASSHQPHCSQHTDSAQRWDPRAVSPVQVFAPHSSLTREILTSPSAWCRKPMLRSWVQRDKYHPALLLPLSAPGGGGVCRCEAGSHSD